MGYGGRKNKKKQRGKSKENRKREHPADWWGSRLGWNMWRDHCIWILSADCSAVASRWCDILEGWSLTV